MGDLTEHFNISEFACHGTKVPTSLIPNVRRLCVEILQPLREHLGAPIKITSGWRTEANNNAVRGALHSRHLLGMAADFAVLRPDYTPRMVLLAAQSLALPIDQIIGYDPERGGHVHVQISPREVPPRGMYLWAPKGGIKQYVSWRP